jgi:FixJ family two-component response regulator
MIPARIDLPTNAAGNTNGARRFLRIAVLDTPHIAVIDDDDSVREATKHLIGVLGYDVETFASAEAFLNSSQRQATICVITDVQMTGMSGLELHRRLSASSRRTPVIFVTAYFDETTRDRVLREGAAGYLSKPLDGEKLLGCLEKALAQDGG